MSELKTLKEIQKQRSECCSPGWICEECIKAEAVKWVKDLEAEAEENNVIQRADAWIKHFFNLTGEALGDE